MSKTHRPKFAFQSLPTAVLIFLLFGLPLSVASAQVQEFRVPILVYHRLGETVSDRMTVTVPRFESQLQYLRDNGYKIIPLRELVQNCLSGAPALPERSVVITADDGHRTIYTHMLGLARKYQLPVTLFIYPSAISNAEYALTWEQLRRLKQTGLYDVQSHSFWHPNFHQEKQRLSPSDYRQFARMQLAKSKQVLEAKLGGKVDLLAWPFGIFDDELIGLASKAGYVAGFTIEGRHATARDAIMALPRYLITQAIDMQGFNSIMSGGHVSSSKG